MHPIIERNTIRRLGTDSQFDQNPPPALTFITFVMVTDIAHASSRGSGDLQCKAHMPPISAGTRAGLNPYAYPNVNWYDELFKDQAFNQNFNVNIRGDRKSTRLNSSHSV